MAWTQAQAKLFADKAKKGLGAGWGLLVPAMREAVIAQAALSLVLTQDCESVRVDDVYDLLRMMREAALVEDV